MPFPLFLAPVAHAAVDDAGSCEMCGRPASVRFSGACYKCFRNGGVEHTVDTEFGMVRVEDAQKGLTHGIPLSDPSILSDYELIPHPVDPKFPEETWFHVRIETEFLLELVRTPTYLAWQGEHWQFCCRRPCVFLGRLPATAVSPAAESPSAHIAAWFRCPDWSSVAHHDYGSLTYYGFRCAECNAFRYHEDTD
ncbi:CbrC family protein [Novipirellula caenicola]